MTSGSPPVPSPPPPPSRDPAGFARPDHPREAAPKGSGGGGAAASKGAHGTAHAHAEKHRAARKQKKTEHHASAEQSRATAKRARESARHAAGPAAPPTPALASPLHDVFQVSLQPDPPRFDGDARLTLAMHDRAVSARLGDKSFAVALGGSLSVTARLEIKIPNVTQLFHDWHCSRCGRGLGDFWRGCKPMKSHDPKCNRCGTGLSADIRDAVCQTGEPLSPPEVKGTFRVDGDLTVDIHALAHRYFLAFEPQEMVRSLANLPVAVADAFKDAFQDQNGGFERLRKSFDVPGPARDRFDRLFHDTRDTVVRTVTDKVKAPLVVAGNGLKQALDAFASAQLGALNELFQKAVELLALLRGDAKAIIRLATTKVCAALRTGQAAVESIWNHVKWLVDFCVKTDVSLAQWLVSQLVIACKDQFQRHRDQLDVLLNDDLAALHDKGVDMLAFARGVLTAARDAAGDVAASAKYLVDVVIAIVPAALASASDFASTLGSLTGLLLQRASEDVGAVLGPLGDRLAEVHRVTGDEVKLILSHLGDDTIFKRAAQWVHDNIARFGAAVKEGLQQLIEWLKQILELILAAGPQKLFPGLERFVDLLKKLQGLTKTVLAPPELAEIPQHLRDLERVMKEGVLPWLHAQAEREGTTVVQYVKDFISEKNPLVQNLKRIQGAVLPLLGEVQGEGKELIDAYVKAVHDLEEVENFLWGLMQGGAHEGPFTALVSAHGLLTEPLEITGGQVEASPPTSITDAINKGEQVVAGLATNAAPDMSFIQFDVNRERLVVPHPCDSRPVRMPTGSTVLPFDPPVIPLAMPLPWDCSVAVCHLPQFHVIDMRYHFPYGDLACYHVADQDNDGFVRHWEVQNVRAAVTKSKNDPNYYDFALDCDGDGAITEDDLQLAIEQQDRYVNGIMYRPTTGPLGYFLSPAPGVWGFYAFTDLNAESIPRGVKRRGILAVLDGQVIIPIPNINYPIRFHIEQRMFLDEMLGLVPGSVEKKAIPLPPGFAPLTPSVRYDAVLRGGRTGRDWQFYAMTEPLNPMLMTFNFRGTLYFRAVASGGFALGAGAGVSAGVGGKGAGFIHVSYEMSAPLVEVAMEWSDRITHIVETKPADLPIPWAFIQSILEWTDVPRLCRALIQLAGPVTDLIFDWCDEGHTIRAALGYLRQYELNRWEPAKTWEQVRFDVAAWSDLTALERDALLGAVREAQREVGRKVTQRPGATALAAGDEDAVYVPWLLAKKCREALARLDAPPPASGAGKGAAPWKTAPAAKGAPLKLAHPRGVDLRHGALHAAPQRDAKHADPKPHDAKHGADPKPHDHERHGAGAGAGVGAAAGAGGDHPAAPDEKPDHVKAEARIKAYFEDGAGRFAASLDQLVPLGPVNQNDPQKERIAYASAVTIPLCGAFEVLNPFIAAFPVKYEDLKANQHPSEATLDEMLSVRGNPFYKPIYHTVVEFGHDAKLYTAPNTDPSYFITGCAGQLGLVEGNRVLEDDDGNRWLWVRTKTWQHGWLFIDGDVCRELFSIKEAAEVAGKDLAQDLLQEVLGKAAGLGLPVNVLDPDKINKGLTELEEKLEKKGARPTVTRIEASAKDTVDESRHARICRAAFARKYVGRETAEDRKVLDLHAGAILEFKQRLLGVGNEGMGIDDLAEAFNALPVTKREKLWSAGTAWFKLLHYMPIIAEELLEELMPPVLHADFDGAFVHLKECLKKCSTVELEELLLVSQSCAPAVKEVVLTMIDMGMKLKSIKDMVVTGQGGVAGGGQVGPANQGGQVTWKDLGVKLMRLLVDDEDEPGRPPAPEKPKQRGLRQDHDAGISFSFEATVKVERDKSAPQRNEYVVALAKPMISRVEDVIDKEESPEVGETIEAHVTEWGALVYSEPPRFVPVATDRIPKQLRDAVAWQVRNDDAAEWIDVKDAEGNLVKGERVRYTVTENDRGKLVKFRASTTDHDYAASYGAAPAASS